MSEINLFPSSRVNISVGPPEEKKDYITKVIMQSDLPHAFPWK